MPGALQDFLVHSTAKAAANLEAALLRLPEDKRDWVPMGGARTALDMVAECAILGAMTVEMIRTRSFPADFDRAAFAEDKSRLAGDWPTLQALLHENNSRVIAAIAAAPDDALEVEIPMPWGPQSFAELLSYPYWNMSYHEGQINYIASMLGCLP